MRAHDWEDDVVYREPLWELRLNAYQRENLLRVLRATEDTGDWHGELRFMLEPQHQIERVHRRSETT